MRLAPWQDAILDRLRDRLADSIEIIEGGYTGDVELPRLDNGMIAPYVMVWFGGSVQAGVGHNGIAGVRRDSRRGLVDIECAASAANHARLLGDEVRDALVGFKPDGEGELEEDGDAAIRNPINTTTAVDVRYAYPLSFQGFVNTAGS